MDMLKSFVAHRDTSALYLKFIKTFDDFIATKNDAVFARGALASIRVGVFKDLRDRDTLVSTLIEKLDVPDTELRHAWDILDRLTQLKSWKEYDTYFPEHGLYLILDFLARFFERLFERAYSTERQAGTTLEILATACRRDALMLVSEYEVLLPRAIFTVRTDAARALLSGIATRYRCFYNAADAQPRSNYYQAIFNEFDTVLKDYQLSRSFQHLVDVTLRMFSIPSPEFIAKLEELTHRFILADDSAGVVIRQLR